MSDPVADGGIQADKCGGDFNNCAREPTALEQEFLQKYEYHMVKEARINNPAWNDTEILEQIDQLPDRHPAVEQAFQNILDNPDGHGVSVESNSIFGKALGQGDHDFKSDGMRVVGTIG